MHIIAQPYDYRHIANAVAAIHQRQVIGADGLETLQVLGGTDEGQHQGSTLIGGAILHQLHPIWLLTGDQLVVIHYLVVAGKTGAHAVAQEFLRRGEGLRTKRKR